MSSDGVKENGENDEIITMQDVLAEQEEMTRDADAVLGGSDAENCTYQLGYVARQALYSCKTCSDKSGLKAGICLACSLKCHDGHELFELYTKRNFRCDCGLTDKFPDTKCELDMAKGGSNDQNSYNQNFDGKYCSCHRPYPDTEYEDDDVMIQCISCEDWFHGQHLETPVPESYSELICKDCTSRMHFLKFYREEMSKVTDGDEVPGHQTVEVKGEETVEDVQVEQESGSEDKATNGHDDGPHRKKLKAEQEQDQKLETDRKQDQKKLETDQKQEQKKLETDRKQDQKNLETDQKQDQNLETDQKQDESGVCKLEERRRFDQPAIDGPSFWSEKWRESLCKCSKCLKMYEGLECCYLTDVEDTVHSYEERGRIRNPSGGSSIEEAGQQALETKLSSMPRAAQIEMIHGYNELKEELTNFLRPFSERGQVVTTEHVKKFIEDFKKKKESEPKVDVYSGCH